MTTIRDVPEKTSPIDHHQRQRLLALVQHAGTCTEPMTADELQAQRRLRG